MIKDSSLASVIAVMELTYEAGAIEGQSFRTFEIYITIGALYLLLVTTVTLALRFLPGEREKFPGGLTPVPEVILQNLYLSDVEAWPRPFRSPP